VDLKPGKTAPQLYVLSRSCRLHLSNEQLQAAADRQVGSKIWAKDFYMYGGYVIYLVRWSYWKALRVGRLAFFPVIWWKSSQEFIGEFHIPGINIKNCS
jgi:hypothetical protein